MAHPVMQHPLYNISDVDSHYEIKLWCKFLEFMKTVRTLLICTQRSHLNLYLLLQRNVSFKGILQELDSVYVYVLALDLKSVLSLLWRITIFL